MTKNVATIKEENIIYDLKVDSVNEIINQLAEKLLGNGDINDKEKFIKAVIERENEIPTSIGDEMAIPHGKSESVVNSTVAIGVLNEKIIWGEESDDEVKYVFLLAIKEGDEGETHLRTLANLSSKLMDKDFVNRLKSAKSKMEFVEVINQI